MPPFGDTLRSCTSPGRGGAKGVCFDIVTSLGQVSQFDTRLLLERRAESLAERPSRGYNVRCESTSASPAAMQYPRLVAGWSTQAIRTGSSQREPLGAERILLRPPRAGPDVRPHQGQCSP